MKSENRDYVKLLMDGVARGLSGGHSFTDAAAGLSRGVAMLMGALSALDSEVKVDEQLAQLPDPSPAQLQMLAGVAGVLPAAVTEIVRDGLETANEDMPNAKTGPKNISTLEKASICQQVLALIGQGCTQGAATQRVSQRTGRSVRSIQRIFAERGKLQSAFTVDEVKQGILSLVLGGSGIDATMLSRFAAGRNTTDSNESGSFSG